MESLQPIPSIDQLIDYETVGHWTTYVPLPQFVRDFYSRRIARRVLRKRRELEKFHFRMRTLATAEERRKVYAK